MVEILWKSNAPHLPVKDHELVELRLLDLGNAAAPRFLVREIHAAWSASKQQIQWKGYNDESCATPQEAQARFKKRKAAQIQAGFAYSTVLA
ncbi:MAG TPA: hypothetical protein VGL22_10265 [Terracidiphilus sp.]|jgi:hypothetical protein